MTVDQYYPDDDMRNLIRRSRDILALCQQLQRENPDVPQETCMTAVMIAFRDWDTEGIMDRVEELTDSVNECQKDIRYLVNTRGVK